ncbi:MAG: hypothetical protein XXXJIFNMEKO3_02796 [Candidatus Erwinia impunctatus]|nr:hypothetical protein XXXJIFNMEKO_02796 [Culicoides impunctatus]
MKRALFFLLTAMVSSGTLQARPLNMDEQQAVEKMIQAERAGQKISFIHQDFPYPEQSFTYCGYLITQQGRDAGVKQLFATFMGVDQQGDVLTASFNTDGATGEPTDANKLAFLCASAGYDLPVKAIYFDGLNQTREKSGIPLLDKRYRVN